MIGHQLVQRGAVREVAPLEHRQAGGGCGSLHQRGVFDKSHIGQASSARRLVIEATYAL